MTIAQMARVGVSNDGKALRRREYFTQELTLVSSVFVDLRENTRQKDCSCHVLSYPSLQQSIGGLDICQAEENGLVYLKIPLNAF